MMNNFVAGSITGNLLKGLSDFLLPIVGIALVIFVVMKVFQIKNGNAAFKDLLVGLLAFVVVGGIISFASTNFKDTSSGTNQSVQKAVNNAANQTAKNADGLLSGNGK